MPSASCAAKNYSPEQDAVQMKVNNTVNQTTKQFKAGEYDTDFICYPAVLKTKAVKSKPICHS